ncbi:multiprotein-bridging factor 1, partial [Coemansia erecta]
GSGSGSGSDAEPVSIDGLGALSLGTRHAVRDAMDVDTAPLLPAASVDESPRQFRPARFVHGGATGLETKMQSFSISDDDDGGDGDDHRQHDRHCGRQLAWLRALAATVALAAVAAPRRFPPALLWAQRALSVVSLALGVPLGGRAESAAAASSSSSFSSSGKPRRGPSGRLPRGVRWLGAAAVVAWLVEAPAVLTLLAGEAWPGHHAPRWLRWPLARAQLAPGSLVPPQGGHSLLVYLDCAAELAALAYSARQTAVRTNSQLNAAARSGSIVSTQTSGKVANKAHHVDTDHRRIAHLDRSDDVGPPPTVTLSVSKAIQKGRQDKSLSQKELAQKINEKDTVIRDYEAGKAVPSQQVLSRLERVLEVKLRGTNIGDPLPPRGTKKK